MQQLTKTFESIRTLCRTVSHISNVVEKTLRPVLHTVDAMKHLVNTVTVAVNSVVLALVTLFNIVLHIVSIPVVICRNINSALGTRHEKKNVDGG